MISSFAEMEDRSLNGKSIRIFCQYHKASKELSKLIGGGGGQGKNERKLLSHFESIKGDLLYRAKGGDYTPFFQQKLAQAFALIFKQTS